MEQGIAKGCVPNCTQFLRSALLLTRAHRESGQKYCTLIGNRVPFVTHTKAYGHCGFNSLLEGNNSLPEGNNVESSGEKTKQLQHVIAEKTHCLCQSDGVTTGQKGPLDIGSIDWWILDGHTEMGVDVRQSGEESWKWPPI